MAKVIGQREGLQVVHAECGAVLEYHPHEVTVLWSSKDYSGGSDGAKGFKCPKCGLNVILERW